MAMTTSVTTTHLTRSEIWSAQLKEVLRDELAAQAYVRWLTDFPDGEQLNIPSIGEATVRDYVEDTAAVYDPLDTGEFNFSITEYKQSGSYITRKARQDAFYAGQLEASFVPKQARALAEQIETDILSLGGAFAGVGQGANQTADDPNQINGADHRFVATGTSPAADSMALADFAKALFALKRANVPDTGLIAIVDPTVEYTLNTLTNIVGGGSQELDPRWQALIETGIGNGMRFIRNVFGFAVFASNYLPAAGSAADGGETISTDAITNGVCNQFMSLASPDIVPYVGAWRQQPMVDSEFNKDRQREEYITTGRYGLKLYRPENLVVVLSDTSIV